MHKNRSFTRRQFLKLGSSALLAAGTGAMLYKSRLISSVPQLLPALDRTGLEARYIRQIITPDSHTSRTIMWQTDALPAQAAVLIRPAGSGPAQEIPAQSEAFEDDGTSCLLHTASISGLAPGTAYEYCLADGHHTSTWLPLHTEDEAAACSALIFPDSQSNDYSGWQALARQAYARNPQADFFVNMGDLVDNGEDHKQWEAWFEAVAPLISAIPVVPVMGNHETYDENWKVRLPHAYLRGFAVPGNGEPAFNRCYYSFDYGPVHFAVLDTQWDEMEGFCPGLLAAQLQWLPEDMQQSSKKWKIILLHKDVLQYRIASRPERQEGFSDVGQAFMPLFDQLGIDLVLSAHLHTYRNRGHIKNFKKSGAGPLYILTGVAGNVRYPGLWTDHALDETIAPQPETDNYLTLDANTSQLRLRSFLPDGSLIDDCSLMK
jgi:hypothetical protein